MVIIVASFAIKFTALNKYEAPPSPDYGNYLTQANVLRGNDVTGLGLRYSPLFFVFLNAFRIFLDEFMALKVLASLTFSVIAIPFYILAKKLSRNYLAALASTWVFLFFEGYSEMIAWGGNPNFLGFSFMLLTVFFLVDSINAPSRRNIFLTGVSLSLVIGTHLLVTVFTFLFFSVFVALTLAFNRQSLWKCVRILLPASGIAAGFSLPYFPVYATLMRYYSTDLIEPNLVGQVNAVLAGLGGVFGSQYLIMVIMTALGIFALSVRVKEYKTDVLVLCGLFALPLMLSLITENPDRWFYFLPIPVMLSFALYLAILFRVVRGKRKELLVLTFYFILLISIGSAIFAASRLERATAYYQTIGDYELQALKWVRDGTSSNATFATSGPNKIIGGDTAPGSSYSWWIEGFAERKSLHTGLTSWYTYRDERLETALTNQFFLGTYVFEHGSMRTAETFPAGLGNPEIAKYINGQYRNLLFLNDGEEEVAFSPVENEQIVWHEAPFYATNKTTNIQYNQTRANATFSYTWPRLKLTRSLVMNDQKSSVDVVFELVPLNSTLRQLTVNIWGSFFTSLESFTLQNATVSLQQRVQTNDVVETSIVILDTDGKLNNTEVFSKDPKYSMPRVTYSFTPLSNSLYVHFRISSDSATAEQGGQKIAFFSSYDLSKDLGINYIFLNKARIKEYRRFIADSEHYSTVFENETIVIFKVL